MIFVNPTMWPHDPNLNINFHQLEAQGDFIVKFQ